MLLNEQVVNLRLSRFQLPTMKAGPIRPLPSVSTKFTSTIGWSHTKLVFVNSKGGATVLLTGAYQMERRQFKKCEAVLDNGC